jgi:hypothetical protein
MSSSSSRALSCPRLLSRLAVAVLVLAATFGRLPAAGAVSGIYSALMTPTAGGSVDVGMPLLITGFTVNGEGGAIESTQVSVDGGETWLPVNGLTTWSLVYTPTEPGELDITSRASDGSFTRVREAAPIRVMVGEPAEPPDLSCPCLMSLPHFSGSPQIADPDTSSVEVGVRFRLDRPGFITHLLVSRSPYTEPITGHLWGPDGTLLASTPTASTPFGSATLALPPVQLEAGVTYVASYFTPEGHYDSAELYFSGTMIEAPFTAIFDESGGAGVYQYGDTPSFPTQTWNRSNYWVTPVFKDHL